MRQLTRRYHVALGLALVGIVTLACPAYGNIIITPTIGSTITSDANAAGIIANINQAVSFYENTISTNITVSIDFEEMGSGLGQSSTFVGTISYSQYLAALQGHSSGDSTDLAALASLPAGPNNPVNGTTGVTLSTANLRALGFTANPGAADSTISVNTSITNFTGQTFNPSKYSLLAVIEHEMDEALGLGSALDSGSTTGNIRPEDLFRYSANGVRSFTTSTSATSYFSIDSGGTNLIGFNQSGGGADYGDWASSATPHVQDAFGTPGGSPVFDVEQIALDAVGYNLAIAAVPEPSTLGFIALGLLGILAGAAWRSHS